MWLVGFDKMDEWFTTSGIAIVRCGLGISTYDMYLKSFAGNNISRMHVKVIFRPMYRDISMILLSISASQDNIF